MRQPYYRPCVDAPMSENSMDNVMLKCWKDVHRDASVGEVCKLTISKFQTYMYVLWNTLFVHCEDAKALFDGFSKRTDWLVGRDEG